MTPMHVQQLVCDPIVRSVEVNCPVDDAQAYPLCDATCQATGTQSTPANLGLWGVDRVDARTGRNGQFISDTSALGENTVIYVMDTGMNLNHIEFSGDSGSRAEPGFAATCVTGNEAACGRDMGFRGVIGTGPGEAPAAAPAAAERSKRGWQAGHRVSGSINGNGARAAAQRGGGGALNR